MKHAIFLLGSMGAGKSTIIERATFQRLDGFVCRCQEFDGMAE